MEELLSGNLEIADKDALVDELMNQYGTAILKLAYSYVNNKEIAEDLTQEIFVKCYKSIHTYEGKSTLKTWLWRIAINHCKDFLKSWYNKNVIVTEDEKITNKSTKKEAVEQIIIQKEADHELLTAVMMLPIEYREVIYLFYY